MSVKKSSPVGTVFTVIIVAAIIAILYYGLVLCTQAGPEAEEAADRAAMRLTSENISNISGIPYSLLSEPFKLAITEEEYNEIFNQDVTDENTLALFEKLNDVVNEPQFLQGAATYWCGTEEKPVTGIVKIKGIEYEIKHSIMFAPNVKSFEPEVIKWSVSVERLTYA